MPWGNLRISLETSNHSLLRMGTMLFRIDDLLFVDFEASSLDEASWPIELGAAWIADGRVLGWSSLIRPAPEWNRLAWSLASAQIHGIPKEDLETAPAAREVAGVFKRIAYGKLLVSDNPEFEERWANRLMSTTEDLPEVRFLDFDAAAGHVFDGLALDYVYETLQRKRAPHRAGEDARRLASAFLRGLREQSGLQASLCA